MEILELAILFYKFIDEETEFSTRRYKTESERKSINFGAGMARIAVFKLKKRLASQLAAIILFHADHCEVRAFTKDDDITICYTTLYYSDPSFSFENIVGLFQLT